MVAAWGWYDPEPALRAVANHAWPFPAIRLGSADRVLADYTVCAMALLSFACARHAGFWFPPARGACDPAVVRAYLHALPVA